MIEALVRLSSEAETREYATKQVEIYEWVVEASRDYAHQIYTDTVGPWIERYTALMGQTRACHQLFSPVAALFPETSLRFLEVGGRQEVINNEIWWHTFYWNQIKRVMEIRRTPYHGVQSWVRAMQTPKYTVHHDGSFDSLAGPGKINPAAVIGFGRQITRLEQSLAKGLE